MGTINGIIGRQREVALLQEIYESPRAEFVAVYGRRRIGKTYLIDKFFGDKYDFYMTGIYEGTRKEQLVNFAHQLEFYSHKEQKTPKDWMEALFMLRKYLETLKKEKPVLLFFDEMPWLDTRYSRFLKAFELFWNEWASKQDNLKLIVCGSATTWMTNTLLGNKGGLHNRVTRSIYLRPFNLAETEEFLVSRGFSMERFQIAELYMAIGGTPFYLNMLNRSLSVAQNIDELFFSSSAPLRSEYGFLFKSLFKESTLYRRVGQGVKSEGSLVISGTKGYIYVPAPWWKTDYFEVRYENPQNNKRYFYQLDGEGLRYELLSFLKAIRTGKDFSYVSGDISRCIIHLISDFEARKDMIVI